LIKNDFITNSSSTSFIYADRRKDKEKSIKIKVELEVNSEKDELKIYSTKEEILEHFSCLEKDVIEKLIQEVKKGNKIIVIEVQNHGYFRLPFGDFSGTIDDIKFEKGIIYLGSEEG